MPFRRLFRSLLIIVLLAAAAFFTWDRFAPIAASDARSLEIGTPLDSLHGVVVYHNGTMGNVSGRNVVDGYNVGLRYQCVEYVKRYYLEHYGHRMPDSYGHAKDFFQTDLADGALNKARGLIQYTEPSATPPAVGDLLVFDAWPGNPYGHVAIVAAVEADAIEVVQQNTGSTRENIGLKQRGDSWHLRNGRVLGRLRMP